MKKKLRSILRAGAIAGAALAALSAAARFSVRRFEKLELESAGAPGSFVDVDGARLHYVEAGTGEPVVLIHGLGASTFTFRHTIPELAQRYRVVAIDLRGFGYSDRSEADYSLETQADLVARAMERLGIARAVVAGHSMGGAVAQRLALRHPARVERLVLVDSATDHEWGNGRRRARLMRPFAPMLSAAAYGRRVRRRIMRAEVHDPAFVTDDIVEEFTRSRKVKGSARVMTQLLTADRFRDEPVAVERIQQPTLVLWGEHDRLTKTAHGEELARRLPNARLVWVPGAGHLPLEEQPEFSNRALLSFLQGETAAPDRAGAFAASETAG